MNNAEAKKAINFIKGHITELNDWEKEFLSSVTNWVAKDENNKPSDKQVNVLKKIVAKYQ